MGKKGNRIKIEVSPLRASTQEIANDDANEQNIPSKKCQNNNYLRLDFVKNRVKKSSSTFCFEESCKKNERLLNISRDRLIQ